MDDFAAEFPYEPTPDQCQVNLNQLPLPFLLKNATHIPRVFEDV
jgi:hypothetical protein